MSYYPIYRKYLAIIVPITILLLHSGCDEDDPVAPEANQPPRIQWINSNPSTSSTIRLPAGDMVRIAVLATDSEQDELSYTWLADEGQFDGDTDKHTVRWISPISDNNKDYIIRVTVSDGELTAEGDITIYVKYLERGMVSDIDGNVYQTVKIGDWWWMAENLRVTRYRNGDSIPTGLSAGEWEKADYGAYAVYPHYLIDGLSSAAEVVEAYGKLYNWFTVDDPRGVCPEGWQVPNNQALYFLLLDVGGDPGKTTGGDLLKSVSTEPDPHPRWRTGNVTKGDLFGWSALPGRRALWDGRFSGIGTHGNWLSATQLDDLHSFSRILWYGNSEFLPNYSFKQNGNSIRCFRYADES